MHFQLRVIPPIFATLSMKILISYLKRYKFYVILSFALAAINQSFSLLDPVYLGKFYNYINNNKVEKISNQAFLWGALGFFFILIGVAMVSRIAKAFQDFTVNTVIQRFGADVYTDGLKHALQLPYQKFEDQRSGETLAVLEKVRTDSEKLITSFINVIFQVLVSVVFVTVYSLMHYPPVVFLYLIGTLILSFLTSKLSKRLKFIQKNIVGETTALAGATTESLRNIELIRSLGLTNQEILRLNNTTQKILKLELRKVKSIRALSFVQGTVVNLTRQCIVLALSFAVFHNTNGFEFGQMLTMQFFSFFIFGPLQELGNIIMLYREAETSLENFEKLMLTPVEAKPLNPIALKQIDSLQFSKVAFQHASARNNALNGIDFHVNKGETIAFVGPSGSGKTTLVKLLVGLYKPYSGEIHYNSINSKEIDFEDFRNQIGFVTQDTQLFSGTIRENLLFVKPEATEAELIEALHKASCQNLLARADKGLDSVIGEGGMKVSGGEKQRLSIARSLLRNPKLLVFDEATSSLDSLTEEEITNTIRQISDVRDHITIMIAHRLSTIMHADRIYVLEKGDVVETGTHEQLVSEKGLYYAMWRQQIGERKKD
jgi:ATP-binding cassette subfamily B protein